MHAYSPFFETLHDETSPTGHLGRGTHCSVLRAVAWHDEVRSPLAKAVWLDFAVVWDEDHDSRVIDAVTRLYFAGLLSPVQFIGERKGTLSVVMQDATVERIGRSGMRAYEEAVTDVCQGLDDPWTTRFEATSNCRASIINDDAVKIQLYLSTVDMLWSLGIKPAAA